MKISLLGIALLGAAAFANTPCDQLKAPADAAFTTVELIPAGPQAAPAGRGGGGLRGGLGGLLDSSTPSAALVKLLSANASSYSWVAASVGANSAAGVQLATQEPILAIGGFNGTDPTPTLAQFEQLVAKGRIHYFLSGGSGV